MDKSEYIEISGKRYRKNVGIMVYNESGKVLLCERLPIKKSIYKRKYKWQFPQGGIDIGEKPEETALRELYEETGIKSCEIIYEDKNWRSYKFPLLYKLFKRKNKAIGQIQKWFLVKFTGNEKEIHMPSEEFINYKWIELKEEIIKEIVPFKRKVYEEIIKEMQPILKEQIKNKKAS